VSESGVELDWEKIGDTPRPINTAIYARGRRKENGKLCPICFRYLDDCRREGYDG
jgi:hypothetical protein